MSDALACRPTMRHRGGSGAAACGLSLLAVVLALSLFLMDDVGDSSVEIQIVTTQSPSWTFPVGSGCDSGLNSVNDSRNCCCGVVNDRQSGLGNCGGTTRVASMGIPSSSSSDAIVTVCGSAAESVCEEVEERGWMSAPQN
jgi:hypothetical protein